jgi:uncharacterized protein
MKYTSDDQDWIIRLQKGELLVENLTKFVQENDIKAAWMSGLGAALWVELGFYDLEKKQYLWKKFEKELEITGIHGNVSREGDTPMLHMHGTFSDQNMQAFGGHIKDLQAGGTVEIFLQTWQGKTLTRSHDPEVGLKLLDL